MIIFTSGIVYTQYYSCAEKFSFLLDLDTLLLDWPQRRPTAWDQVSARLISRPDRGCQPTDGCGPLSHCAYTKGGEGLRDRDDGVRCDPFPSPTSPSDRSLRRSGGGNLPHHFRYPALTRSSDVRAPQTDAPRIYFHFTDKYHYAGSNDVKFIGQALRWDTPTLRL
jgi:hypothetical protein